jgi:hypothetical protein
MHRLRLFSGAINRLTNLNFLASFPRLLLIELASNLASSYQFPEGLSSVFWINLGENQLTNVVFPQDMQGVTTLYLDDNRLTSLPSIAHMERLHTLDLSLNRFSRVVIPRTLTQLSSLDLRFNPLKTVVLPDLLATNRLAELVNSLRSTGVVVHAYRTEPLLSLNAPEAQLLLQGPPGVYDILESTNLTTWSIARIVTNETGTVSIPAIPGNDLRDPQRFFTARAARLEE